MKTHNIIYQEGGGIPTSCYVILIIIFICIIYLVVLRKRIDEFFIGTNQSNQNNALVNINNTNTENTNTENTNIGNTNTHHLFINKDINPFEVEKVWQGKLPNSSKYLSFWQRKNKKSLDQYSLGQMAMISSSEIQHPSNEKIQKSPILNMLVKGGKYPITYIKIWSSDMIQNNTLTTDLSIWQPIPPEGYTAMGDIAVSSLSPPSRSKIVCLPNTELTDNEQIKANIYTHTGIDADQMSIWNIGNYGAFMGSQSNQKPETRKKEIKDILEKLLSKKEYDPNEKYTGISIILSTNTIKLSNNTNNISDNISNNVI
jgi:hypothetical protein